MLGKNEIGSRGMITDLKERSERVIAVMREISGLSHLQVDDLRSVPLGLLREGTYNLQGVCRYSKGVRERIAKGTAKGPSEVRCIDIHPLLLTEEWSEYADHVLFHEYLHALLPGVGHGPEFRALESLWPDEGAIGKKAEFGQFIRERRSDILKWELKCPSCGERYLRKEPMPGARCGRCKTVLDNIER